MSGEAKYSQPLPETPGPKAPPVVVAGFVGKGRAQRPGFIFLNQQGKQVHAEITRANVANEKPAGFFRSLARIFGGSK
jgi:hypothetical protein